MERTNFEKLHVYQLSEKLADSVWHVVINWDTFAKDTVGKQIVRAADSIGRTFPKEAAVATCKTTDDLSGWRAARCMKRFIWLRRSYLRRLLTQSEVKKLRLLVEELAPKLNAFLRSV
jgi:23S rRNA-intervening sequence protein